MKAYQALGFILERLRTESPDLLFDKLKECALILDEEILAKNLEVGDVVWYGRNTWMVDYIEIDGSLQLERDGDYGRNIAAVDCILYEEGDERPNE